MYTRSLLILLAGAGLAHAQYPSANIPRVNPYGGGIVGTNPNSYAPVSPYLNLLRGGDPAVNYLFNVQPGLDYQQQLQSFAAHPFPIGSLSPLRSGFLSVASPTMGTTPSIARQGDDEVPALLSTGRPATFMGTTRPGLYTPPASSQPFGGSLLRYKGKAPAKKK